MGDNVGAIKIAVESFLKARGCATLNEMRRFIKYERESDFAKAVTALLLDDETIRYVRARKWADGESPLYTLRR